MNDDFLIPRNSGANTSEERPRVSTGGNGCLSVMVVSPVFGLMASLLFYALGYSPLHAMYAGLATMAAIWGLYFLTVVASILVILAAITIGVGTALWLTLVPPKR